jgi:PAS domain S-box-containing protein
MADQLLGNAAVGTGRSVTLSDGDDGFASHPWQAHMRTCRLRSAGAFPLRCARGVVGALVLFSREQSFFDAKVCRLLDELAADVSLTLEMIEQRQAHEAARGHARAMEALFHQLFHLLPVTAVLSDVETGELIEINQAGCERYGLTREAMVGKTLSELGVGPHPLHLAEILRQMELHGKVKDLEIEGTDGQGRTFQSLVHARYIDYRGRRCLLSSSMDITRLKAMQSELQEKAQADAANEAKTTFVSQMSHELRTPLNAMLGLTQLLDEHLKHRLSDEHGRWIEQIEEAGWFLLSLIDDVLDLSRIELGRLEVSPVSVPLGSLVQTAIRLVSSRAGADNVAISSQVPQHLYVKADPKRLLQVLVNVLANARKYNRPGGTVTLKAAADEANVRLRIEDTGVGMTQEQVRRLFEPFNRLGREAGDVEGAGIGLALSLDLMRLMQGTLDVESRLGVGTTVNLVLPLAPETQRDATPAAMLLSPAQGEGVRGKVLYVEDNDINVLVVRHALMKFPRVEFEAAPDGAGGLAACRRLRPDLVLLDMQLPDMSGLAVLDQLRNDPVLRDIPVIALSANAMPREIHAARAAGVTDYLTKPLDLPAFLAAVRAALAGGAPHACL